MILIVSNNNERTTTEVIKWLSLMKKKFIRIHEDEIFNIRTKNKKILLESKRSNFFLDEIESVWYRRGGLKFNRLRYQNNSINIHMHEVQDWLEDYVRKTLENKRHINKESHYHVNKLLILEQAEKAGLDVPKYSLTENTDDVVLDKTITKPITGHPMLFDFNENYDGVMYTTIIETKESKDFFISFFQEKIEKDFEIRTFYLNGKCWSMAIFSQNDEQTKVDYRKYNRAIPNRNVPYNLPKKIEEKIKTMMHSLDINCGSLDFIKNKDKYYFLEINPIGQFANVSYHCNYELYREVANYL